MQGYISRNRAVPKSKNGRENKWSMARLTERRSMHGDIGGGIKQCPRQRMEEPRSIMNIKNEGVGSVW
jgi:hypothetical protein